MPAADREVLQTLPLEALVEALGGAADHKMVRVRGVLGHSALGKHA